MAKRDYYELLGVGRDASGDDLKKSYRKLAMKYHPDRNPGDEDSEHKFKELSEAYDVLRDGEKRAAYDQFGHAAFEAAGGPRPDGFDFTPGQAVDLALDRDGWREEKRPFYRVPMLPVGGKDAGKIAALRMLLEGEGALVRRCGANARRGAA